MAQIVKRLLLLVVGILLTFIFVRFVVWQLPGTLADVLSDSETNLKDLEALAQEFKTQSSFWAPLRSFFSLDWGQSQLYAESSFTVVMRHFALTTRLSLWSLLFTAIFSATYFVFPKLLALRLSNMLLALPAIAVYPAVVFTSCALTSFCPAGSALQGKALFLASLVQGFISSPRFFRELDWELEEIRRKRFVLVLRAKGLSRFRIWSTHILMNALAPVFSLLLLTALSFFSGAVLVEALFDLPGMGMLLLEAIRSRDFNLIFPTVMFLSLLHLVTLQSGRFLKMRRLQGE